MATTKTIHQSFGSRLGDSFKGILTGFGLFIAGIALLFWNEGRTVRTAQDIAQGEKSVVEATDVNSPDPEQEGKFIHFVGKAVTEETLADDVFAVSVNGLRLKREVEMYQWVEVESSKTKENIGGSTDTVITYSYKKEWNRSLIDSSEFAEAGHDNPAAMEFSSSEWQAENVKVGGFTLPERAIDMIHSEKGFVFPKDYVLPESVTNRMVLNSNVITILGGDRKVKEGTTMVTPEIGDLRVSFKWTPCHEVSVMARQMGDTIEGFKTKNGGSLMYVKSGSFSAEEMVESAKKSNRMTAWFLRAVGFLLLYIGMKGVLGPIETLASVLPFLGKLVGAGTGIIAALIAIPVGLVTVAIAWITYRPVLGISLLVVAVAAVVFFRKKALDSKAAAAAAPAEKTA